MSRSRSLGRWPSVTRTPTRPVPPPSAVAQGVRIRRENRNRSRKRPADLLGGRGPAKGPRPLVLPGPTIRRVDDDEQDPREGLAPMQWPGTTAAQADAAG